MCLPSRSSHPGWPHLDSCCFPSQDCHSPISELKTKSDDCPAWFPLYVCYSLAPRRSRELGPGSIAGLFLV